MNKQTNNIRPDVSQFYGPCNKEKNIGVQMRSVIKLGAGVLLLSLVVGCASGPSEPKLTEVQRIQIGDDQLDCSALKQQISSAEAVIAKLTKEIESDKSTARAGDTASAINSYLGQTSVFNDLLANSARNSAEDDNEVRKSYQDRRDILLQQYMAKNCT